MVKEKRLQDTKNKERWVDVLNVLRIHGMASAFILFYFIAGATQGNSCKLTFYMLVS